MSCEDKVNVALDTANPKLVIDANILWQKELMEVPKNQTYHHNRLLQ